jgi:hypothetical protein
VTAVATLILSSLSKPSMLLSSSPSPHRCAAFLVHFAGCEHSVGGDGAGGGVGGAGGAAAGSGGGGASAAAGIGGGALAKEAVAVFGKLPCHWQSSGFYDSDSDTGCQLVWQLPRRT